MSKIATSCPRLPVPSSQVSAAYSPSPYKVTDAPRAVVAACRPGPPATRSPATELIVARTTTMADRAITATDPAVDLRFGICLMRSLIFVSTPAPSPKMPATGKSRRSLLRLRYRDHGIRNILQRPHHGYEIG